MIRAYRHAAAVDPRSGAAYICRDYQPSSLHGYDNIQPCRLSFRPLSMSVFVSMQPPNWQPEPMVAKNYSAPAQCIYCGALGNLKHRLTKEHIIPRGLDGRLIFRRASCVECAKITGQVEQTSLRGPFLIARTQMGLRTRRPKERPHVFPIELNLGRLVLSAHLPEGAYPSILIMLMFREPDVLSGAAPRLIFGGEMTLAANEICQDHRKRRENIADLPHTQPVVFEAVPFSRMLAKIAHSYTVAELGLGSFRPTLLPIITGDDLSNIGQYVGGNAAFHSASAFLHEISLGTETVLGVAYCVVTIRLFASLAMPVYRVVAGVLP
jgi:hypothetical protein